MYLRWKKNRNLKFAFFIFCLSSFNTFSPFSNRVTQIFKDIIQYPVKDFLSSNYFNVGPAWISLASFGGGYFLFKKMLSSTYFDIPRLYTPLLSVGLAFTSAALLTSATWSGAKERFEKKKEADKVVEAIKEDPLKFFNARAWKRNAIAWLTQEGFFEAIVHLYQNKMSDIPAKGPKGIVIDGLPGLGKSEVPKNIAAMMLVYEAFSSSPAMQALLMETDGSVEAAYHLFEQWVDKGAMDDILNSLPETIDNDVMFVEASDIKGMYVGQSEKNLQEVIAFAEGEADSFYRNLQGKLKRRTPWLVFNIDEVEQLLKDRNKSGHYDASLTAAFLARLQRLHCKVIFVGSTNIPGIDIAALQNPTRAIRLHAYLSNVHLIQARIVNFIKEKATNIRTYLIKQAAVLLTGLKQNDATYLGVLSQINARVPIFPSSYFRFITANEKGAIFRVNREKIVVDIEVRPGGKPPLLLESHLPLKEIEILKLINNIYASGNAFHAFSSEGDVEAINKSIQIFNSLNVVFNGDLNQICSFLKFISKLDKYIIENKPGQYTFADNSPEGFAQFFISKLEKEVDDIKKNQGHASFEDVKSRIEELLNSEWFKKFKLNGIVTGALSEALKKKYEAFEQSGISSLFDPNKGLKSVIAKSLDKVGASPHSYFEQKIQNKFGKNSGLLALLCLNFERFAEIKNLHVDFTRREWKPVQSDVYEQITDSLKNMGYQAQKDDEWQVRGEFYPRTTKNSVSKAYQARIGKFAYFIQKTFKQLVGDKRNDPAWIRAMSPTLRTSSYSAIRKKLAQG